MKANVTLGRGWLGRAAAGMLAGAVLASALSSVLPEALGAEKVPGAEQLRPIVKKLYGDANLDDYTARKVLWAEIDAAMAKAAGKDKKNTALRHPGFWVEAVQESMFTGKRRKSADTKSLLEGDVEWALADGKPVKAKFAYHGGTNYSAKAAAPLLISVLEKGADAKAWITNSWLVHEDFKKNWIHVAVPLSDSFDLAKDPVSFVRLLGKTFDLYNVDVNRVFVEGVGSACTDVQRTLTTTGSDRIAGVVLRNPQEAVVNDNSGLFATAVVAGPEGADKAKSVADAYAKVSAERNALVTAPDVASLQGACAPIADWLRAHKGRTVPSSYKFVTVFSTDGTQGEPWTGTLYIRTPGVRGQPTTVEVTYLRDSNTVNINCTNLGEFEVFMNDDLLDLDKEVGIFVNSVPVKKDTFERRAENMFKIADDLREYGRFFPCSHVATVPAPQPTPANDAPKGGGDKPADKPADEKK